ncbi:MAG: hypothetical protein Q8M29_08400 [Bacteroidota bacterium]|nr:hypothetical protein [Bacteroidota bacterium]
MKHRTTFLTVILLLMQLTYGQRNIIGEYSTIHKFSWGSGLELFLKADSTFAMTNYELKSEKPVVSKTVNGRWTTTDSARRLVLYQIINDTLQLIYNFPFTDNDRMLAMTCKDSTKSQSVIDSFALEFYPMVFYKVKGYYPSGQLESDLPRTTSDNIDHCPPTGFWKYYYPTGNLKGEFDFTDYENDKGVVTRKEYYENGKTKSEQQWKDGLKDGRWKEYDDTGNLKKTQFYNKDKLKGEK